MGVMVDIKVEYANSRQVIQIPLSVANQFASRERILSKSYRAKICHKAITSRSYRAGHKDFNYDPYQKGQNTRPLSTYVDDIISEGTALIEAKRMNAEAVLGGHGFDGRTGLFEENQLPPHLRNTKAATVLIDPEDLLRDTADANLKDIHDPEVEDPEVVEGQIYSEPDTDEIHLPPKPRTRNRRQLPVSEIPARCSNYIRWRQMLNINDNCKVKHPVELETDPDRVLYLMIDGVYVSGQAQTHIKGGKTQKDKAERVEHWNCRIEWGESCSYAVTDGKLENMMKQVLAFLLTNNLTSKYFVFIVDGEDKIFAGIETYFGKWEHTVYLDFAHAAKKCYDLLSNAIKSIRVADPRGKKEYYVKGSKAGQVKSQEMTSLSVLYTRRAISMLWVGNINELREYLKNIDPNIIHDQTYLDKLMTYFSEQRKGKYVTNYALRKVSGLRNSSNGVEGLNNQSVACNQKQGNKSFRDKGSHALAALMVLNVNREWEKWFAEDSISFAYIPPDEELESIAEK